MVADDKYEIEAIYKRIGNGDCRALKLTIHGMLWARRQWRSSLRNAGPTLQEIQRQSGPSWDVLQRWIRVFGAAMEAFESELVKVRKPCKVAMPFAIPPETPLPIRGQDIARRFLEQRGNVSPDNELAVRPARSTAPQTPPRTRRLGKARTYPSACAALRADPIGCDETVYRAAEAEAKRLVQEQPPPALARRLRFVERKVAKLPPASARPGPSRRLKVWQEALLAIADGKRLPTLEALAQHMGCARETLSRNLGGGRRHDATRGRRKTSRRLPLVAVVLDRDTGERLLKLTGEGRKLVKELRKGV